MFVRAGGLMDHFERNRCTRIKFAEFEKRRAMKEMIMAQMAGQAAERPATASMASESGDPSEDDGGVALNMSSLLDNFEDDSNVDYPTLAPHPSGSVSSPIAAVTSPRTSAWPELVASERDTASKDSENRIPVASGDHQAPNPQEESISAWGGRSSSTLFPNAPQTPAPLNWAATITESVASPRPRDDPQIVLESTMDPNSPRFNPFQFRNAIGMFRCPYPKCR